jgi:hypothetical protein
MNTDLPNKKQCSHVCKKCEHVCETKIDEPITEEITEMMIILELFKQKNKVLSDAVGWLDQCFEDIKSGLLDFYKINEANIDFKVKSGDNDIEFIVNTIENFASKVESLKDNWSVKRDKYCDDEFNSSEKELKSILEGKDELIPKKLGPLFSKVYKQVQLLWIDGIEWINEQMDMLSGCVRTLQNEWSIHNKCDSVYELKWLLGVIYAYRGVMIKMEKSWNIVKKNIMDACDNEVSEEIAKYPQELIIKAENYLKSAQDEEVAKINNLTKCMTDVMDAGSNVLMMHGLKRFFSG